jgi:hypothetical protein
MIEQPSFDFDGATYEPALDRVRLNVQMRAVAALMLDGRWRTLRQISDATGSPEASVSARLRDMRKPRFGLSIVERERMGDDGLHRYRLLASDVLKRAVMAWSDAA